MLLEIMYQAVEKEKELKDAIMGNTRNYITSEESETIEKEIAKITGNIQDMNDIKEMIEVSDFINNKPVYPEKYFCYLSKDKKENTYITNWTGAKLGRAIVYNKTISNFGDERIYFYAYGINGIKYHGINYGGFGSYCRIKAYKNK